MSSSLASSHADVSNTPKNNIETLLADDNVKSADGLQGETKPASGLLDLTEEEDTRVPKAPDGGWAWVVLLCTILSYVVRSGVIQSFSVLFTDLIDYFEEETSVVAWVQSIFVSTDFMCGK